MMPHKDKDIDIIKEKDSEYFALKTSSVHQGIDSSIPQELFSGRFTHLHLQKISTKQRIQILLNLFQACGSSSTRGLVFPNQGRRIVVLQRTS